MKNNKGITIVEIIISVSLIAIVLVFLFSVLITVRNEDEKSRSRANMLINQAIIIKEAETDFIEYELMGISSCKDGGGATPGTDSIRDILPTTAGLSKAVPEGNCIKLFFNPAKTNDNIGYLLYYTYGYSSDTEINVVGYRRGDKRVIREVPNASNHTATVTRACAAGTCAINFWLPVVDDDGEDYGIHLSYSTTEPTFSYTAGDDATYKFNRR